MQLLEPGTVGPVTFWVSVESITSPEFQGAFTSVDIVLGSDPRFPESDDHLEVSASQWTYDPAFVAAATDGVTLGAPSPVGVFASDLKVGGLITTGAVSPPFVIGTLVIDVSRLPEGTYSLDVGVGSELANSAVPGAREALVGGATLQIGTGVDSDDAADGEDSPDSGGGSGNGDDAGGDGLDTDNDGVPDEEDAFPLDPQENQDTDGDGLGDGADPDDDGDGVNDEEDLFPADPEESADTDGNGVGDNADPDDDGDGVADEEDAFPLDPAETTDSNNNGLGDNAEAEAQTDGQNSGARVGGGLCGAGGFLGMMLGFIGMFGFRLRR